jgi:hypothetical protein
LTSKSVKDAFRRRVVSSRNNKNDNNKQVDDDNDNLNENDIDVNPFVFQTFKTIVMFIMCLLVSYVNDISIKFSYWGNVSGLVWIRGGTFGVVAVGTWASIMIRINFIFRTFIQQYLHSYYLQPD